MTARSVQQWFEIIQRHHDDAKLARQALGDLTNYRHADEREDVRQLENLFAAIRLDQMVKEGSA